MKIDIINNSQPTRPVKAILSSHGDLIIPSEKHHTIRVGKLILSSVDDWERTCNNLGFGYQRLYEGDQIAIIL